MKALFVFLSILVAAFLLIFAISVRYERSNLNKAKHVEIKKVQVGRVVQANVTVVSVFFKFSKHKYLFDNYARWQRYFFRSVSDVPIVVYTDRQSLSSLVEMSLYTSNPKTFYVFESIWSIVGMIEADRGKPKGLYSHNYKETQPGLDPEGRLHNPSLYAVWNAKSFLLKHASSRESNVYGSGFFIYSDIGAFRGRYFPRWPDVDHVAQLSARMGDRVLLSQISESSESEMNDHIIGGFIAGSPRALEHFYTRFYDIHDARMSAGQFIGKDQTMMNIYARTHANRTCRLWPGELRTRCRCLSDIWFMYQDYFSSYGHFWKRVKSSNYWNQSKAAIDEVATELATCSKQTCEEDYRSYYSESNSVTCNGGSEAVGVSRCYQCYF